MPAYKRVLLKLSGEALMGDDAFGINRSTIEGMVNDIAEIVKLGVQVAVVIGGGNIFRGVAGGAAGMDRAALAATTYSAQRCPNGVSNLRPRKLRINLSGGARSAPVLTDLVRTPQFESSEAPQTACSAARRAKFSAKPKTELISPSVWSPKGS